MKNEGFRFYWPSLNKHDVSDIEAIEALNDPKASIRRAGPKNDPRYLIIGSTADGRILEIIYRIEDNQDIFIFHVMDARTHQKKLYKKK